MSDDDDSTDDFDIMTEAEVGGGSGGGGNTKKAASSAAAFGKAISSAFAKGIANGKQLDDILKSLSARLSELALKAAFKPIEDIITKSIGGLLGGLSKGFSGGMGAGSGLIGGGGMGGTGVTPFADGGVIASPHYFPLGSHGTGLAGEAGPEAIMPLSRGADGRLGVAAGGGARPSSVTINIATPDAASFRQSDVYLSGLIAKAVGRGQRGL
ncbi:hypothetical protein GJW-30_1_03778 [Variibacter gotjawalensis]|uniref:Phage tail tape measure protein, lambda family n=1 Tax=Variibacter gotjawalensis TaxID=1333996 RepID=A0A0S3PZ59_9BRAD|nr:phage tail tape measure protein [Variibacter gotjawalensis]NIK47058.1 phage-related minor tail protein [Variibacter gotjawalensis]RZS48963.1 hypothetical protein EV661_1386 [Variibacter gotjawalensis]BAT61221.1 hypothetical protein GJW-30_1_03778 [Variibacter gotjawalensis]